MIEETRHWSAQDSSELYDVKQWGNGFFSVGEHGHLQVHPNRDINRSVDLKRLIDTLNAREVDPPILLRFGEMLRDRMGQLNSAFDQAIADYQYSGTYACVYPIKVNQQRRVVEEILKSGKAFGFGLEAGSKPELLAIMATADNDTPLICNGFKDEEFIELAMLAAKIGRKVTVVVERYHELRLLIECSRKVGVRPAIGMRIKLASRGSGRWRSSGGYRSKFGLTMSEALQAVEELKREEMADCLELLHFHLGSQITNIRHIKGALTEAARVYVELHRAGAGLKYMDVGGGLGVDYDGSQTNFESSVNYTLQEYANDVVYHIGGICDDADVPHPNIVSESGRAVVAYHGMLVFNVLGVAGLSGDKQLPETMSDEVEQPLRDLFSTYQHVNSRNLLESFHDAQAALDMALNLFNAGYLPMAQRCAVENLFWGICRKIQKLVQAQDEIPEELDGLDAMLADTYFCNFSLFQSTPDSWAIKQLFPIVPIHRLDERPSRHAVLCDITCDSDGKIDQFIDRRDVKKTLQLHPLNDEPYYLGIFLVGAYQEILGDLHNLFGDTNAVHVGIDDAGEVVIEEIIRGDTVHDVLDYVDFNSATLIHKFRTDVETAVRQNKISDRNAGRLMKFYEEGMGGYTYLEDPHDD